MLDEEHTQVEQKETVQSQPQQQETMTETNIDVKLVRSVWPYLNPDDPVPTESTLKGPKGITIV